MARLYLARVLIYDARRSFGLPGGARDVHTMHGLIHGLAGLPAYIFLAAASFVMSWSFAGDPASRRWATYSALTGLLIVACFIAREVASVLDAQLCRK